jgi:hypothetical protein
LWFLDDEGEAITASDASFDLLRLVSDDHDDRLRVERGGRAEHVLDHRAAGDVMKHLGPRRLHARPLSSGQNDDMEVQGTSIIALIYF